MIKPLQDCSLNVPKYSFFKMFKLHKQMNGQVFARGQNVPKNGQKIKVISPSIMTISVDLPMSDAYFTKREKKS